MRLTLPTLTAVFVSLGVTISAAHAEAVKVSPQLTVFTQEQTASEGNGPTVLRGSATRRGTVNSGSRDDPGLVQLGVGSTLWLADPETGALIACEPSRTSRVNSRFVRCFDEELPF